MDTDSIRIWICFALGFGVAELFINRLVFISAALACLATPLISAAMLMKDMSPPSAIILAGGIFVATYVVLVIALRTGGGKPVPREAVGPVGERFELGPTIPGKHGPEFILRIDRRVYVVMAPGMRLRAGETVEITSIEEDFVTVKPLREGTDSTAEQLIHQRDPNPQPAVNLNVQPLNQVETVEEEGQSDELSPLLDSISRAVSDEDVTIEKEQLEEDDNPPLRHKKSSP